MSEPTRVAIACRGGGSHTAFTCGVLRTLLAERDDEYELVGISGSSGGAGGVSLAAGRASAGSRVGGIARVTP